MKNCPRCNTPVESHGRFGRCPPTEQCVLERNTPTGNPGTGTTPPRPNLISILTKLVEWEEAPWERRSGWDRIELNSEERIVQDLLNRLIKPMIKEAIQEHLRDHHDHS